MPEPEFSFASLIKPGEGALRALKQHLTLGAEREQKHKRPQWRYAGQCDFLLQHGTFFTGRELPEEWEHLRGPQAECHDNALAAAEADPSLRFFTGLYVIGREPTSHSWCVDANGELLEFTLPNAEQRGRTPCLAADRNFTPTRIPMLTPPHWAYVGVEYDTAFVRQHADIRGNVLLDPHFLSHNFDGDHGAYLRSEDPPMWMLPYDKAGFPIPPVPNLCGDCMGHGDDEDGGDCQRCGGSGIEP